MVNSILYLLGNGWRKILHIIDEGSKMLFDVNQIERRESWKDGCTADGDGHQSPTFSSEEDGQKHCVAVHIA